MILGFFRSLATFQEQCFTAITLAKTKSYRNSIIRRKEIKKLIWKIQFIATEKRAICIVKDKKTSLHEKKGKLINEIFNQYNILK